MQAKRSGRKCDIAMTRYILSIFIVTLIKMSTPNTPKQQTQKKIPGSLDTGASDKINWRNENIGRNAFNVYYGRGEIDKVAFKHFPDPLGHAVERQLVTKDGKIVVGEKTPTPTRRELKKLKHNPLKLNCADKKGKRNDYAEALYKNYKASCSDGEGNTLPYASNPCDDFMIDVTSLDHGLCTCGFPRSPISRTSVSIRASNADSSSNSFPKNL